MRSPSLGRTCSSGSARSGLKVTYVGYQVTGAFTASDSTRFPSPMRDSVALIDTLVVPATATGQARVAAFMIDSLGQRSTGTGITLTIQSPSTVTSTPAVAFGVTPRV